MFSKLDEVEEKYKEIERLLTDPSIARNPSELQRYTKEHSELSGIVQTYRELKNTINEIEKNKSLLKEVEIRELAQEEINSLEKKKKSLEEKLRFLLLPKDPNDKKNIFLEIRAGTGGNEAALFASDLFRMYARYAERRGWKVEIMDRNEIGIGGFKEIIAAIEGEDVYSRFKYESGVHRVQRVPVTESGGRIHTSTATVAVLPEPDDVEVEIDEKDLKIDTFRSSGPGGQHVNKTDSAVRITHIPTGIIAICQDEKSQHKNRTKAMRVLKARLYEMEEQKRMEEMSTMRKNLVGSGDRSEKIRTYNFPQGRITDHRIGLTLYRLEEILDGNLEELIKSLSEHYQAELLREELH